MDHERLRKQALDEPARLKERLMLRAIGGKDEPHQSERRDVEDRGRRPDQIVNGVWHIHFIGFVGIPLSI